jgi:cobalt-zinc-cadmium efflux system protein
MREKKILWIIVFNLVIIVSEIAFGFISNSFALIADALHNIGDVIAVAITYLALRLASTRASFRQTFGFLRAEMMAGFVNTLFLFLTMFYMIYEASFRFFHPEKIEPIYMIVVGIIAVIANGVSAYILNNLGVESCSHGEGEHGHHHEDTNIRSAYLHMLADALISVGVVVAGIFIYFFEIYRVDSLLTVLFSIYILFHSYPLLKKSFLSLMDIHSLEVTENQLDMLIKADERVSEYHDLHIYTPSSKDNFISFHIVLNDESILFHEQERLTKTIKEGLEHLGFNHILIQVDGSACKMNSNYCINEQDRKERK